MEKYVVYTDSISRRKAKDSGAAFVVYKNNQPIHKQNFVYENCNSSSSKVKIILDAAVWLKNNLDPDEIASVIVYSNSELIVNQINEVYAVTNAFISKTIAEFYNVRSSLPNAIIRVEKRTKEKIVEELCYNALGLSKYPVTSFNGQDLVLPLDISYKNYDFVRKDMLDMVKNENGNLNYQELISIKKGKSPFDVLTGKKQIKSIFGNLTLEWLNIAMENVENKAFVEDVYYWCSVGLPPEKAVDRVFMDM